MTTATGEARSRTAGHTTHGQSGAPGTGGAADRRRGDTTWPPPRPAASTARLEVSRANRYAVGLAIASLLSWVVACLRMDPSSYTDLGLLSATDGFFWAALAGGIAAFTCAIRARHFRWPVALLALVVIIAVLYATPSWIEGAARVEAVYRHVGIADRLARSGVLDRNLDAYFNWPGFFSVLGMIQNAADMPQLLVLARWAPPLAALGYVAPVLLIARALSPQPRLQWLAIGTFLMVNWTGQDYLSPQTFAFWLLLCLSGILMSVIRRQDDPDDVGPSARISAPRDKFGVHRLWIGEEGKRVRLSRFQWRSLHVLVLIATAAMIASHQLTPFMLVMVLFGLWLVGRTPHWWLWVVAATMIVAWLLVPAWPFVSGHFGDVAGSVSNSSAGASSNLGGRVSNGSAQHHFVVDARMAQTLVVWLMASLGTLLMISERRRIRGVVLLAGLPFLLIPLQSYGGEMLIRAYLFGLPLVGFLVAVFLFSFGRGRAPWRGVALAAVLMILASTTVLTRYGNERGESFTPAEVETLSWFFKHTKPESTVEMIDANSPRNFHRYATDIWLYFNDAAPGPAWKQRPTPDNLIKDIAKRGHGKPDAYLIYTKSQAAMAELSGNVKPGVVQRAVAAIEKDPRFTMIYHNADGIVWKVRQR